MLNAAEILHYAAKYDVSFVKHVFVHVQSFVVFLNTGWVSD